MNALTTTDLDVISYGIRHGESMSEIARAIGRHPSTVKENAERMWRDGLLPEFAEYRKRRKMMAGRKYPDATRAESVRLRRLGFTVAAIADKLCVSENSVRSWTRGVAYEPEQV